MANDIDLFFEAGPRAENDARNRRREELLAELHRPLQEELRANPRWCQLHTELGNLLRGLCAVPYDTIEVRREGGRGAHHDFVVQHLDGDRVVASCLLEYKHNIARIDALPEYFSPAANKPYLPRLYADFFYDRIDELCALYPGLPPPPDRQTYARLVHGSNYDRHPFFRALNTVRLEHAAEKRRIVCDSIRDYLHAYKDAFDIAALEADIRARQTGKVFVMWDRTTFHADTFRDDEMALVGPIEVENDNRLVIHSRGGTRHRLLLRWKNHLGILYPAWQISLAR